MINHHKLVENNYEKEIYLFLDFNYEFGIDFKVINKKVEAFNDQIIKYIKEKEIDFTKGKVFIVVGGVILGTLFFNNNKITSIPEPVTQNYEIVEKINVPNEFPETTEETKEKVEQKSEVVQNKPEKISEVIQNKPEKKITKVQEKQNTSQKSKIIEKTEIAKQTETKPKVVEKTETKPIVYEKQITLHRSNGQVINLELESYIIGVVGAEMPASFNVEALKAQSVLARTYALKKIDRKEKLSDTTSHQVYKDNNQLKSMWGSDFDKYYNKIKQAVASTTGEYLTYNGDYIEAIYHSTSNGKTEDSLAVWGNSYPYLKSVDSHWDLEASSYSRRITKDFDNLRTITGIDFNENTNIKILSKTNGNRIDKIKIDDTIFSGIELRTLLGLRSADFDIIFENGKVIFITRGYGHGVGMSQYGANGMAKEGSNYINILKHYYPGTTIKK